MDLLWTLVAQLKDPKWRAQAKRKVGAVVEIAFILAAFGFIAAIVFGLIGP